MNDAPLTKEQGLPATLNSKPFPKGYLGGECNRGACKNQNPGWWSQVEHAYYCESCATEINKWVPAGVPKMVKI
jgi:hypothetical protein